MQNEHQNALRVQSFGQISRKPWAISDKQVERFHQGFRMLQPLRLRCVDCVIHHERDVREEWKYIYVARASNNKRGCDAWSLLLLAAVVRSFAHMPLGISDRTKMVLWPGWRGRAEFSLHTSGAQTVARKALWSGSRRNFHWKENLTL